jgi:hypothetical protein
MLNNRAFFRNATRFNRVLIKLSAFKKDPVDSGIYPGLPLLVIQAPAGQTADIFQVMDSLGNVLFSIPAGGISTTVPAAGSNVIYKDGTGALHIA